MAKAKRIKGIDCNSAACAGIRLVLLTRFQELYGFQQDALNWTDPEGVHSMRVASRRLRSALRDFMPYLRKRGLPHVLKQLRKIARALGEVRDLDVAIPALEDLQKQIPAKFLPALKQSTDTRNEVRERAREGLTAILQTNHLQQFESEFIAAVNQATAPREGKPQISFSEMSSAIIQDRLKELERLSDGLFRPFDVEPLHEMRIAAKRLRYAIELFEQCWKGSIGLHAKRAARLQTALGDVHDCDVWIESFGKQINEARKNKQEEQVAAFVWLLSYFTKLRNKHLRKAFREWNAWEAHDISGKLRAATRLQDQA
jgi:CHAD domain-containing protein